MAKLPHRRSLLITRGSIRRLILLLCAAGDSLNSGADVDDEAAARRVLLEAAKRRSRARVTSGFRDLAGGADDISANNIGGAKVAKVESRDEKSAV